MTARRAAAYILTRRVRAEGTLRVDAKTHGVKRCRPGNKKCGGRCIPVEWDCRLNGEGGDSHLRAAGRGSDPLAALANFQRGVGRAIRGVTTGNFSELEGGRKALIRGVVKASPQELKEKKELQAKLITATIGIGIVGAVLAGGVRAHSIMMASPLYRNGPGRRLEDNLRNAYVNVADAVNPIRRQRASAARSAASGAVTRTQRLLASDPETIGGNATRAAQFMARPPLRGANAKGNARKAVTQIQPRDYNNVADWHTASIKAFWKTPRTQEQYKVLGRTRENPGYFFATVGTENLLRDTYGIRDSRIRGSDLISAISAKLNLRHKELADYAADQGFDMNVFAQRRAFAERMVKSARVPAYAQRAASKEINVMLLPKFNSETYVRAQYRKFNDGYDKLIDDLVKEIDFPIYNAQGRRLARTGLATAASEGHAEYIGQLLYNVPQTRVVRGPASADLVIEHYFNKLGGRTKPENITQPWQAPTAKLLLAAGEYSGRQVNTPAEALSILQAEGAFKGMQYRPPVDIDTSLVASRFVPRGRDAGRQRFKFSSIEEKQTYLDLAKSYIDSGKYKDYAAALRAARREIIRRRTGRGDAALQPGPAVLQEEPERAAAAQRLDKKCGKSGIPDNRKCTKPTAPATVDPASAAPTLGRVGAAALAATGAVVGGRALVRNRQSLTAYKRYAPRVAGATIRATSSTPFRRVLKKLPKQYQDSASKLTGKAKVGLAKMAADAKGFTLSSVDDKNNYTTWINKDKGVVTNIGSVGDSLVMFTSAKRGKLGLDMADGSDGADVYDMDFTVDTNFSQKQGLSRDESKQLVKTIRSMYGNTTGNLPDNIILRNTPYGEDSRGAARASIYSRAGFRKIEGSGSNSQWAMFSKGKVKPIPQEFDETFADAIRGFEEDRSDAAPQRRLDKKCGKSGIAPHKKCTKPTAVASPESATAGAPARPPEGGITARQAQLGGTAVAAIAAAVVGSKIQANRQKLSAYRKNVSKSALEAERLATQMETQMRTQAAARLKKRPEQVTGFEASVYNYKDKGYDRGFASTDNTPRYFGQTQNSRGAVVMLSYADDGVHTIRGQGGFKLTEGGIFKSIWGEHDILPYANNISQPGVAAPDDLQRAASKRFTRNAERVAGPVGKAVAKTTDYVKSTASRFSYLQQNINERGFNPDAVRAAAFVAAQRRLTGKPVHIMSYSNGGNVASETLAILKEMGYSDVKVVNVAGPTFGVFKHSPDNMQTWVSEGDEFWKYSRGQAFVGNKVNKLNNKNIPHGIEDAINPQSDRYSPTARRERRSYMLDQQLAEEAYKFLTVDKLRSKQLTNEAIWRITSNKGFNEGDLKNLFGDQADAAYSKWATQLTLSNAENTKLKDQLRSEIEDRMIEKWYGGYKPSAVKRAADKLQKEVQAQATPQARPRARSMSYSEILASVRRANPDMSPEAARAEARRRMARRTSSSAAAA